MGLTLHQTAATVRKMAPVKKSKAAKTSESINTKLQLVVKSGKFTLGYKQALKNLRNGKGQCRSIYVCRTLYTNLCQRTAGGRGTGARAEKVPKADMTFLYPPPL